MAKPQIYLSHSNRHKDRIPSIYQRLADHGFKPWWYERDIVPGQTWQRCIEEAISRSDLFLALVSEDWSSSLGHFHTEVDLAKGEISRQPPGRVFVIPVRLEECSVPRDISVFKWIDLFDDSGWPELLRAIRLAVGEGELPPPEPPEELVQAFVNRDVAPYAYVGAGLSAPMDLPMWGELAARLLGWSENRNLFTSRELVGGLYKALEGGDADLVADNVVEAARAAGAEQELWEYLRGLFITPAPAPGPNHQRLRDLGVGAVLTTNFDDLLERTFVGAPVYTFRDTEPLLGALSRRQPFVLKLYGTLDRVPSEPLLVAPRQYEDEIAGNIEFSKFMEGVFVSRTLLFVGASLEGIEAYLRGIKFRGTLSRKHYALVAVSGTAWRAKAEALRRRYQIEVLPYSLSPDHPEVDSFLQALLHRVGLRQGDHEPASPRRRDPARLAKLTLRNIGSFEHLELPLDPRWNVLLGDNGVGKSSILRAVATSLCGGDAQPFAERLLKFDQTTGQVVLQFADGREHVTELFRTSSGSEVRSPGGRLLETEGWLAIGFPALRTVTWRRSRGPQLDEGKRRPNSDDLLPLVAGGADPRTDQLKQWIVNIDYRIKDAGTRAASSAHVAAGPKKVGGPGTADDAGGVIGEAATEVRYANLLREFFRVINRLTGDLTLALESVDPDRGQVYLRTDDGIVPLEAVSQGTVSLLGWIGVLMQRLYEVYDDVERPHEQFALVLMDEIDAHMHPGWQQTLVPALTELFPNVQFIATTHSPLIVGGMGVSQVTRLARDEETGRVTPVEVEPDETMGRADQVLTSGLFGLETTLDAKTQDAIAEYQTLLALPSRTPEQEESLRRAQEAIALRIPPPYESPAERRALELFQALMRTHLGEEHLDLQGELTTRAERLLNEVVATKPKPGRGGRP